MGVSQIKEVFSIIHKNLRAWLNILGCEGK